MWLWNEHPQTRGMFFLVHNNAPTKVQASQLKAMGMVAGVSDTVLLWQGKAYLIEFKVAKGRQSEVQKDWQRKVEAHGFEYRIIRSLEEFKEFIQQVIWKE
jgi:hypothetical protein